MIGFETGRQTGTRARHERGSIQERNFEALEVVSFKPISSRRTGCCTCAEREKRRKSNKDPA